MDIPALLREEIRCSIDFYLSYTNLDPNSKGYGLTVDSTKAPGIASIASTGFALTGWVIAAERGILSRQKAANSLHPPTIPGFTAGLVKPKTPSEEK